MFGSTPRGTIDVTDGDTAPSRRVGGSAAPDPTTPSRWRAVALIVVFVVGYLAAVIGGSELQRTVLALPWEMGWGQQVVSLLFALGFALLVRRLGWRTIGLGRWPAGAGQPLIVATAVLFALFLTVSLVEGARFDPLTASTERVVYEATMPGLAEEIALRGVLLALLDQVFVRRFRVLGASVGWGVVIQAALFGALHLTAGPVAGLFTFAAGLLFGWLRCRTGSLWPPILAHNTFNVVATLILAYP